MLQACLNGNASGAGVPVTPAALAADTSVAFDLGLRHLHLHPRDAEGVETLQQAPTDAAIVACRKAAPEMFVGIGTGAWIAPGPKGRMDDLAGWRVAPDYVSVNLNEPDAPEVMALMARFGIGVEAGIWSDADAARFCALNLPPQTRILIEMPDADDVDPEIDRIRARLAAAGRTEPVLLHGEGVSAWPCLRRAAQEGLSSRIGFEDCDHLPDGTLAVDNASLILAAVEIFHDAGRPLA
ncbi:3-keto-5-aminohexanoate cleavage protein [uncultured Roseobacter sp.]|uniref:3-keto-5-aminohexanoate cleavage protein n=1 Tax=uncultured Roseobacter sp. TaxID=114847 RepID=UPI00260576DD|nr:3-keto-5-aminohexanoate cleavage protein [uncultured Roseobacter sp.]